MNDYRIERYKVVDSTNKYLIERAKNDHEAEGLVVIADSQTEGRGRQGRRFFSPGGSGAYLSILLRPQMPLPCAALVTPLAAVAVCRAIEGCTGLAPGIKWVNDIVLETASTLETGSSLSIDRPDFSTGTKSQPDPLPAYSGKVCGILTEAAASYNGGIDYLVVGIGINLSPPENGFPEDLSSIPASLYASLPDKETSDRLVMRLLDEFRILYTKLEKDPENRDFIEEYRKRSTVIGREITVHRPDGSIIPAKAIDIDNACRLKVSYHDGRTESLNSGEISIRPAP